MESIVSDLAKSNLEKLINAILEQSRYICCFTCITGDFEKERKNLIAKKKTLEECVRVAKRRNDNIARDVTLWQNQAEDLIEEDTKTKVTCFFGRFPNCKWQYSRGKDLESKTEEIKRLMERNFENFGITRDVPDIEYHSSQNYISFKSRKLKFEELFNALTDVNNYMIGLQGMGGTGKTTLAKEMGKELKKSKYFDQVIDTTVSNTPDTKKIQDDIAGPLGLPLNNCTESERPRKLWDRLTNGEKILVILDDVWGDISFEKIGIPLKGDHNGCKILGTTRDMNICHKMDCDKKIQLDIFPEEEGWILFQKHAGLSNTSSKRILNKGRKISKECKGLPIAIAVIAASLKGKQRPEEWDVALQSLQKSMLERGDDENWSQIYTCLKYSYDNMKNETDKKLFLLCSVFREDEDISEELFVRLAIGTGLIENIDEISNYGECRNKAVVAKYKLIDSCLLLHGEFGSVKMHDLVREVALSIANKEILAVDTTNNKEMTMVEKGRSIKYFLFEGKSTDLFSFNFDGSKLDLLIAYLTATENFDVKVPNSFFENIAGLRVLYLSNKYSNITLSLPKSIQSLTNIRSLYLEGFILGDISILRILKDLQTLELVSCSMDKFPREISKLVILKLLNLKYSTCERKNSFKVIESFTSLEELHFIDEEVSNIWHNVHLSNYQRFHILDMHSGSFMSNEFFLRNSLDIHMADKVFCEETFKNLLQKVECLSLRSLQGMWKNLIPEIIYIDDDGESNLFEIIFQNIPQLKCLIDNTNYRVQNVLSNLVALTLYEMENLKEICCGSLPFELLKSLKSLILYGCIHLEGMVFKSNISLCNLIQLYILKCPMLTSLFELSTTQSLILLEMLVIEDCEQLKSIVKDGNRRKEDSGEEIVDAHNHSKSFTSTFPYLKTLTISNCPQLLFILPVVVARNVPKLKHMDIRECNLLKYVFGPYQHKHEEEDLHHESKDVILTTLSQLYLENLPNFVNIFPECDELHMSSSRYESKAQVESNPMKCKILHWIHKYRNKWRTAKIPSDSKDQLQDCSLSMVNDSSANDVIGHQMTVHWKNIALNYMPQTHVDSKIFFTLQNVTVLVIEECKKIEVIFCASMLECLPYMHTLAIFRCNELKQIIGEDTKNQTKSFFPRLKALVIVGCNKLKCVFPISTSKMLSELEVLVIIKACMLEELFQGDSDLRAEIPNMKILVFVELPRLCQEIEFFTVKDCWVKNCPKLSLSSSLESLEDIINSIEDPPSKTAVKKQVTLRRTTAKHSPATLLHLVREALRHCLFRQSHRIATARNRTTTPLLPVIAPLRFSLLPVLLLVVIAPCRQRPFPPLCRQRTRSFLLPMIASRASTIIGLFALRAQRCQQPRPTALATVSLIFFYTDGSEIVVINNLFITTPEIIAIP
uniref:Uncharacterized protein n=1 Tax=Phaseolus vulgaris TaxID=3885 RepID=V7APN1_PHAVU|nr:hypothetical protein PHAVU_010G023200g [Phaseolus vulgaris]ESW06141.1 hypothetical protein PHAVU_010G023200g [Phaseolus vulgaris]